MRGNICKQSPLQHLYPLFATNNPLVVVVFLPVGGIKKAGCRRRGLLPEKQKLCDCMVIA